MGCPIRPSSGTYMMIGLQEKDELDAERETPLMLCHEMFNQVRVRA